MVTIYNVLNDMELVLDTVAHVVNEMPADDRKRALEEVVARGRDLVKLHRDKRHQEVESAAVRIRRDFMENVGPGPCYGPSSVGG